MDKITRRQFLRAAGGITFLALVPTGRGLFAALPAGSSLPNFIVPPYIQPGSASTLDDHQDTLVVAWQTEDAPANFTVEYGQSKKYGQTATILQGERAIGVPRSGKGEVSSATNSAQTGRHLNYYAVLTGLSLGKTYHYRVSGNGQTIAEGYAATRKPRGHKIRFVSFGDNSCGDLADHAIAYYAYQAHPDFVMNTGDNVYESGLDNEYARYFFPAYNANTPTAHDGAPLLRSVPYYTVMANHDVNHKDNTGHTAANFDTARDSLAYYTAMHLPMNGPTSPSQPTPVYGTDSDILSQFKDCAGDRFPRMANYSFDYGDAHFLCLDSNDYVDPTDSALQSWIESDLSATDAPWKFVVYHHPAFNVGSEHYREQHMRALAPLLEKHGVDMCFHGHEHTYQRTMPLRFAPSDLTKAAATKGKDRRVPGNFTIDTKFDGESITKPEGIIYITTGAGGKELYEPPFTDNPPAWLHADDNNVAYVSKFYSSYHSLSVIDLDAHSLTLTQINELGKPIDRIRITKA